MKRMVIFFLLMQPSQLFSGQDASKPAHPVCFFCKRQVDSRSDKFREVAVKGPMHRDCLWYWYDSYDLSKTPQDKVQYNEVVKEIESEQCLEFCKAVLSIVVLTCFAVGTSELVQNYW